MIDAPLAHPDRVLLGAFSRSSLQLDFRPANRALGPFLSRSTLWFELTCPACKACYRRYQSSLAYSEHAYLHVDDLSRHGECGDGIAEGGRGWDERRRLTSPQPKSRGTTRPSPDCRDDVRFGSPIAFIRPLDGCSEPYELRTSYRYSAQEKNTGVDLWYSGYRRKRS